MQTPTSHPGRAHEVGDWLHRSRFAQIDGAIFPERGKPFPRCLHRVGVAFIVIGRRRWDLNSDCSVGRMFLRCRRGGTTRIQAQRGRTPTGRRCAWINRRVAHPASSPCRAVGRSRVRRGEPDRHRMPVGQALARARAWHAFFLIHRTHPEPPKSTHDGVSAMRQVSYPILTILYYRR